MTAREVLAVPAMGAGFAALLALAELLRRRRGWAPETSRKLVHAGGGLLALAIPAVFTSPVPVLALGAGCSIALAAARRWGGLRAVHAVERRTSGSEYYPLAVALLFVVSEGQSWLFTPSVLVLAVADAFAALIGSRFGRRRYRVEDEEKSLEGSLAFLAIAGPAIWLPLRLLTTLPAGAAAMSALLVAALVTGFEAVSLRGSDNLFVPIGVCVILAKITAQPTAEIAYQLASFALILLLGGGIAWRTRSFNVGGALTVLLFCYGVWSLADERWAAAALAGFVAYALARRLVPARVEWERPVRVRIVFRTVSVPFLIVVLANTYRMTPRLGGVFGATIAAALAQSLWNHAVQAAPAAARRRALFAVLSLAALAAPLALLEEPKNIAWGALGAALAVQVNAAVRRRRGAAPEVWGALQMALTLLAATAAAAYTGAVFSGG